MKSYPVLFAFLLVFSWVAVGCDDGEEKTTPDEICDNTLDDDGDGAADCDDSDCLALPDCQGNVNNVNNINNVNNTNNFNNQDGPTRDVDVVFIIDTSMSMADEHAILRSELPGLIMSLKGFSGGLPNLHVGMLSPDLGSSPYNIPGCEIPGGSGARFLKGAGNTCANPVNQTYLVDVEPRGCTIDKTDVEGEPTVCTTHTCDQTHCDQAAFLDEDNIAGEPEDLTLVLDENGCPRCRNYSDETLETVVTCMADLGTSGCGMEQQLEALKVALTGGAEDNLGFLRPDAYLVVIILTDEDDCSVKLAELFNPAGDINSTLGSLSSFRCTEFGVQCEQPWERVMPDGSLTYTGCTGRTAEDPVNMLFPVSNYASIMGALKLPERFLAAVIAGPYDGTLTVGLDVNQNPELQPSCGEITLGAAPAVRLKQFVTEVTPDTADLNWAFSSICENTYHAALEGLATELESRIEALSAK